MRGFTKVLASSFGFVNTTPAFSSSAVIQNSTAFFFSQGSNGGPTALQFSEGVCVQANFGGTSPAGLFNVMGSNVLEIPMFVAAASAFVATTGSLLFNSIALGLQTRYIDFQFVPSTASGTSGFVSVILHSKGNF